MARTVSIGAQGFEELRKIDCFYVDKTAFIAEWWNSADVSTLICRPRRFGKTLLLDTVRCFFSTEFAERGEELFADLAVWQDLKLREVQGSVPVIFISFAAVKEQNYKDALTRIKRLLVDEVVRHSYLQRSVNVSDSRKDFFAHVSDSMDNSHAADVLNQLTQALLEHHGISPIVLLDEYDTPMQEAWLGGFWDEMAAFMRSFMNSTFKTNPSLGRGLMTGITRVSRESIFSDLNNLNVCGVTAEKYTTSFGFTQQEVDAALVEFGMQEKRDKVQEWYDGFCFGDIEGIYNPWSITKYLDTKKFEPHWMNTSGNALAADVVRTGEDDIKKDFEILLSGGCVSQVIDEQIIFSELGSSSSAAWSLLLSSGYLTTTAEAPEQFDDPRLLRLTNLEVRLSFEKLIKRWFYRAGSARYDSFVHSILTGNEEDATDYLNDITISCMSAFDGATHTAESEPERFYHGLVLGLLASLRGRYTVESNRESGRGRYDIMLVPTKDAQVKDTPIIIEFKVFDPRRESTLEDTASRALAQIEERAYATTLIERGFSAEHILSYGIAFRGKESLVVCR
ncbi:MAG: AAA family ATPase [Atopobiaceae bacterium]|nr:AAA family ATPase [Atopobiaceae bacterium]